MTATRATLLALAERVEAATGADRELDALVTYARHSAEMSKLGTPADYLRTDAATKCPRYTASLDAAMSLVPSGQMQVVDLTLGWNADDPKEWPAVSFRWYPPGKTGNDWHAMIVTAATPALALTSASLRAIAGSLTND